MITFDVGIPLLILGGKDFNVPFELHNAGDTSVEVTEVSTPLSAVDIKLDEALTVAAGTTGIGALNIKARTTVAPGRLDVPLLIRYSEDGTDKAKQGRVPGLIAYEDATLDVSLGDIKAVEGEPTVVTVQVVNDSGVAIEVRDISYSDETLDISGPEEPVTVEPNSTGEVEVTVNGSTIGIQEVSTLQFRYVVKDAE